MDITQAFKAAVMAVKLQQKGDAGAAPTEAPKQRPAPNAATTKGTARDEFAKQAKEVCHKITTLRNVLLENRSAYMRIGQHLKSHVQMTDEQRDLIDRESEKFVTFYAQHLAQMRADWKRAKRKPQQADHIDAVLELLDDYLRSVQQIYVDQKKYRVQHELETYRLLKLASDKKKIPVRPANGSTSQTVSSGEEEVDGEGSEEEEELETETNGWEDASLDICTDGWDNEAETTVTDAQSERKVRRRRKQKDKNENLDESLDAANSSVELKSQSSQKFALDEDIQKSQQLVAEEEEAQAAKELSPEDVQMFEEENVQLYNELQGLSEEVEQIEKNVVDIAQLQDIFTEKVSLQQQNIDRIASIVIGATENVKDANEQIKQAIQRNAGLRVWSLFFLLVMSFALLFLDWYYD